MSEPRAGMITLTLAAALALLPSTAEAGGDAVYGTRGGELLTEREHEIELTFARGHVEMRVRRTVHNGIDRHDEAQFWLAVPWGAVATSLRSLGELDGKPKWFEAELLEAEAAAARYRELTGLGGYYPKDPALLSWRSQTELALQVFPVAPGTDKTIEYTLEMPATWLDGRWHIELPSLGTEALPAEVTMVSREALDQLFVDGQVVPRGHVHTLDHDVQISLAPTDPEPFDLSLVSIDTGERHFAHWELVLAPEISKVPNSAKIVLIVDLSRSFDEGDVEAQRLLALTYLEHFADPALAAEVAVLGFDREVHELSPGFVSAQAARELLEAAPLQRRNGSELGLALERAADLLASKSKKGARRIVLLSDYQTASHLQPEKLEAVLARSKAVAHLVSVSQGETWLSREDSERWSSLAATSEGVYWYASAPTTWADPQAHDEALAVFEELARPKRIDQLALTVEGVSADLCCDWYETSLAEGQGIEDMGLSATAATKLVVEGRIWNTPLHETTSPSKSRADRWSAWAFGTELMYELTEPEMMQLAMRGGAVSPVTSYLAIEPGVRPSTEGLEEWELGSVGLLGSGGGGGGSSIGSMGVGTIFDRRGFLEAELRRGWQTCGGRNAPGEVKLETQTHEILAVAVTDQPAERGASPHAGRRPSTGDFRGREDNPSADAQRRACMEQVVWSLELPGEFQGFEAWTITL